MYKQLTVVSDTAIYKKDGIIYGFSAVVMELNCISSEFENIVWIGVNRPDLIGKATLIPIENPKIKIILLPFLGGKSKMDMLKVIAYYPYMFWVILKNSFRAEVVHTRAPSHPAFIANLLSFLCKKKIWWQKFAGSWNSETLPRFYDFQKRMLLKADHTKVTINGFWANQPQHCYSFENPCLIQQDIKKGKLIANTKGFKEPFVFAFVGRLDDSKGVSRIIEALEKVSIEKIKEVHFVGDGDNLEKYKLKSAFLKEKVFFHGSLKKDDVHAILAQSDFFLLPSVSEGFPKVIAEAACYGVIPIVSDVGSIGHYINEENGFVWEINSGKVFSQLVEEAIETKRELLKKRSESISKLAELFTFEKYFEKLNQLIFEKSSNQ